MTKREIQAAEYRAEVGPQRAKPASVAQIKAQSKQAAIGVLQAELADLRKRHGDNLEFIKTLVADKTVNQSAKQELAKVFGNLTITELAQKAIEAKRFLDEELTDWAAIDTYCRAKAAEVLPAFEVYGDKESVPPIEAIVDKLVECVSPKRKELP